MAVKPTAETIRSHSPAQTAEIAARMAARLLPGDVVLLAGELGSGKTTFVRGAARALGVIGPVTSPSYAIGNIHAGDGVDVAHLDLYRLDKLEVSDEAVVEDFLGPKRITFIEWPHDEFARLGDVRAVVMLSHAGGDDREIAVEWREQSGAPA